MIKSKSPKAQRKINMRKLRLVIKGTSNYLAFKCSNKTFDPNQTITVFGSIRSGSTWLAELLCSVEGNMQIFEPLHPDYVPQVKKHFGHRKFYVSPDMQWDAGQHIFANILAGKQPSPWVLSQSSLAQIKSAKRLVVKFVRGNLLLDWFTRHFDGIAPILVIRHPCAVIASHLHKGWRPSKKSLLNHQYLKANTQIQRKCADLNTYEELAALSWCISYHAPLSSPKPYRFHLVSYEKLVTDGEAEIRKIFAHCQLPIQRDLIERLSKPSDTTAHNSTILHGQNLLSGWQSKLSPEQISRILNVLKIFNVDFYDQNQHLNEERLNAFSG